MIAFKSPNACNSCHLVKDATWADREVRQWSKRDYQSPVPALADLVDGPATRTGANCPASSPISSGAITMKFSAPP